MSKYYKSGILCWLSLLRRVYHVIRLSLPEIFPLIPKMRSSIFEWTKQEGKVPKKFGSNGTAHLSGQSIFN